MDDIIQIPAREYALMKEEISLLKDNTLLHKLNRLVEILYEEKYGLYLGNNTNDLTEALIDSNWEHTKSAWDDV